MLGEILSRFAALNVSRSTRCVYDFAMKRQPLHTSAIVCAEPMKKKKRVDPALLIAREQRGKRRLEKAIRRLEKASRKLKPIDEIIGDYKLAREKNSRRRQPEKITPQQKGTESNLLKEWTKYTLKQHRAEMIAINAANRCQEKALNELKRLSPELYENAIQHDAKCIPFDRTGPTLTPPIPGYLSPDGDYQDVTKTYEFPLVGNTSSIIRNLVPRRK